MSNRSRAKAADESERLSGYHCILDFGSHWTGLKGHVLTY